MKRSLVVASRIMRSFVFVGVATMGGLAHAGEAVPLPDPSPILGGDLVAPCGFPTTVSVGGFCTGTLVHPRVVVYAAHCGDQVPWIRFGENVDAPGLEVVPEVCAFNPVGEYGFGTDAAFCRLAEPVEGIPVIPPLMGCEAEAALQVGQPVTVVGFGQSDDVEMPSGIKRRLDTTINGLSWDEVFIGGQDEGVCYGDSGGPTFVQLEGGEWRSFGITSWGQGGCGFGGYLSTIVHNIEWIETTAAVDITPCHDGLGNWDRGPDCTGFEIDPEAGGGDWESGCEFGAVGGFESTCGDAFDPRIEDLAAPSLSFVLPEPYARYDAKDGATQVIVPIEIASDDGDGWGVGAVELVILDEDGDELGRIPDPTAPFVFENLAFTDGVWTLRAEAVDRAGNAGASEELVFGVGVDAPVPPVDPDTSGGGGESTTSEEDSGAVPGDSSSSGGGGSSESSGGGTGATDGGGCGCTSAGRSGGVWWLGVFLIGGWRRRSSTSTSTSTIAIAISVGVAGCGDSSATQGGESSSTGGEGSSSSGSLVDSSTTDEVDSSSGGAVPEPDMGVPEPEPGCGNGIVELEELCDDGNLVDGDGCSAACVPSGTLIEQSLWPEDEPGASGTGLAKAGDGYVAIAYRFSGDDVGGTAVVLGLDADASVTWSGSAAGATSQEDVHPQGLAIDPTGVIIAAGYLVRDVPGTDEIEPWIGRFEPDGTLTWSFSEPALLGSTYEDVVIGPAGDPIVVGSRYLEDETFRLVVRRLAIADGAMVWENVDADDAPESAALAATITEDAELLVAGWRVSPSGRDLWLGRFDDDGNEIDDTNFGEPLTSYYVSDIVTDGAGDAILCGRVVRASAQNAIIGRFTLGAAEPKVWMERIEPPGPGASGCGGLAVDDEGRVAIGGYAFDADESYEHLFARLSADGEILWTARLGQQMGYSFDSISAIVLDPAGDILGIGESQDEADLGRIWIGRVTG